MVDSSRLVGINLSPGTGFLVYIIFALCLPREDRIHDAEQNKLLGVCYRISQSTGLDVGLVRAGAVMLGLASLGTTVIGYFILYFVVPDNPQRTTMI